MQIIPRRARAVGIAAALVLTSAAAGAQQWTATLSGPAEAPPNASPGRGSATFTLVGSVLTINGSFTGLTGTTTAAHIHCCTAPPFTGTAGVATTLPSFVGFPLGVTNGTFSLILDLNAASSYNPAFVNAAPNNGSLAAARATLLGGMNSGTSYLNIHSTTFPGGEIRGFITVVPEPASMLLMATGLLGIAGIATRRKRAQP